MALTASLRAAHRGGAGTPLVLLHGFTDTWRTWEPVLDVLERRHDVLAPTLAGHAGGPALSASPSTDELLDHLEAAMDAAGFATAHLAGNSLGGYLALRLAARGRARSVVALAPAGGWPTGDPALRRVLARFVLMHEQLQAAAPHADAIVATPAGRRQATALTTVAYEHLPAELLAHMLRAAAACDVAPLVAVARREQYPLDAAAVTCPVRIVWGTEDQLLPWPAAALRYRRDRLPHADWVELEGVGHCPQLDVPRVTAELITGLTSP